jgi:prepilin peptidase CpaA
MLGSPVAAKIALVILGVALAVSVVTDVRERRILNVVTYPAIAGIAGCVLWLGGGGLLVRALVGSLLCAAPLLFAMWKGWMGAGDVKLMAVVGLVSGAAAGWSHSLTVLLDVAVAGGVQALLWMAAAHLRRRERPRYVPYGVAIAAGTAWAFLVASPLI